MLSKLMVLVALCFLVTACGTSPRKSFEQIYGFECPPLNDFVAVELAKSQVELFLGQKALAYEEQKQLFDKLSAERAEKLSPKKALNQDEFTLRVAELHGLDDKIASSRRKLDLLREEYDEDASVANQKGLSYFESLDWILKYRHPTKTTSNTGRPPAPGFVF